MKRSIAGVALVLSALGLVAFARSGNHPTHTIRHVAFARHPGLALSLDIYRPRNPGPHPVLMLIHGGSWKRGDKSNFDVLGPQFASEGYVAFSVNYRLIPPLGTARLEQQIADLRTAYRWIVSNATNYGGDPSDIALVGSSAGGHLALMLATEPLEVHPRAVAVFSPPVDLAALADSSLGDEIETLLGCTVSLCPTRYQAASPHERIDASTPPTFLAYADAEFIPSSQRRALSTALEASGVEHEVRIVEGIRHALQFADDVMPELLAFLREH